MIFIVILLYTCNISSNDNCEEAFGKYIKCYNKKYQNESIKNSAFSTFCKRFQILVKHDANEPYNITNLLDIDDQQLISSSTLPLENTNYKQLFENDSKQLNKLTTTLDCQQYYCFYLDPLPQLTMIYESVNLQEAQLVTQSSYRSNACGNSWTYSLKSILESSILIDEQNLVAFWQQFNVSNLNLSVQYLMSNIYGWSDYCNRGDFSIAINYVNSFRTQIKTVELEFDYPFNFSEYEDLHYNNTLLQPILPQEDYLLPFQTMINFAANNTQFVASLIFAHDKVVHNRTFTAYDIKNIMSYLSRGMSVAAKMYITSADQLASYDGTSYVRSACPQYHSNMHVVIIGYGMKNNVLVWVVKNCWGTDWGANGIIYIPIGNNDFCLEGYAYTILPLHYNTSTGVYSNIGDHTRGQPKQLDYDSARLINNTWPIMCAAGWAYSSNMSQCYQCQAGYYSNGGSSQNCSACPINTYNEDIGSSNILACINCTLYMVSAAGSSICNICYDGTYYEFSNKTCIICSAGTYSLQNATSCTNCSAGQYSSSNSSNCSDCSVNTYNPNQASTNVSACLSCPINSISPLGSSNCTPCLPGSFYLSLTSSCQICKAGSFSLGNTSQCSMCVAGSYSENGSTHCDNCSAGYYSLSNASYCIICASNTYSPISGSMQCLLCTANAFSQSGSSKCMCKMGSYVSGGLCQQCDEMSYSNITDAQLCQQCPDGYFSYANSTNCSICTRRELTAGTLQYCEGNFQLFVGQAVGIILGVEAAVVIAALVLCCRFCKVN